ARAESSLAKSSQAASVSLAESGLAQSAGAVRFPVRSQTSAVVSPLPDTSFVPSALKLSAKTPPVCPAERRRSFPVAISTTWTVGSFHQPDHASNRLSGEKAIGQTPSGSLVWR